MQNMDYYSGNTQSHVQPDFISRDPEYFSRMTRHHQSEGVRNKKRASHFLMIVLSLCIVSFTTGLVVGIRFTGGKDKEIVDPTTRKAMTDIGSKVGDIVGEKPLIAETENIDKNEAQSAAKAEITSFPKADYPYAILIGKKFSAKHSQEVADYLSKKGHTVIIARHEGFFRVYAGPYKTKKDADSNLNRINYYTDNKLFHSIVLLKR